MFGIEHYSSFLMAILVFQLIPGAGTIAILNATARNGIGAGLGAVIGTLVGDFIFMVAALAGLAALMQENPFLFELLQYFGAGYLCWLGLGLLRTKINSDTTNETPKQSGWMYLRQACAISLTNPKVMLFFVAFFPLFLTPESSTSTLIAMILHVTLISFIYQAGLVLLGNGIARRLKGVPFARKLAFRLSGTALIAFGIKLALNNR